MKNKFLQPFSQLVLINIFFIVLQLLIIFFRFDFLPSIIPLFFSRPWGKEQLVNRFFIFSLPALSLFFFLLSLIFKQLLGKKGEDFLITVCIIFSLVFAFLQIITVWQITSLVI